jgi:hypothetical protein
VATTVATPNLILLLNNALTHCLRVTLRSPPPTSARSRPDARWVALYRWRLPPPAMPRAPQCILRAA